jgi:hypothetical protein
MQLGSGFEIQLAYAKNVVVAGSMLGLNDNYDLTPPLARFLALNEELIHAQLEATETALGNYRTHHYEDCRRKAQVLSYRFLSSAYDQPQDSKSFAKTCVESERDVRVRRLMMGNEDAMQVTFERLSVITRSEASTWWYLLWVSAYLLHATGGNGIGTGRSLEAKPYHHQGSASILLRLQPSLPDMHCLHSTSSSGS